jgi:hypothetical protein
VCRRRPFRARASWGVPPRAEAIEVAEWHFLSNMLVLLPLGWAETGAGDFHRQAQDFHNILGPLEKKPPNLVVFS